MTVQGPAQLAWNSLSSSQQLFIESLPKAELHAHLNGSIPLETLSFLASESTSHDPELEKRLKAFEGGVQLAEIHDFFALFPAIYKLTSTPDALAIATRAVLDFFLKPGQATYIELRSTPRKTHSLSRKTYVETVLGVVEAYPEDKVGGLILSLDRRMDDKDMGEVVDILLEMKENGRRVLGIDLCGDPTARDVREFGPHFARVREAGLGITLHIAETTENAPDETLVLLSYNPTRLGHATFLNDEAKSIVLQKQIPIEICLSSNVLCRTAALDTHHILSYLAHPERHPVVICTDDPLPFRTTLTEEYALLLAAQPLGLGLKENEVKRIAETGLRCGMREQVKRKTLS